jgi:hypothetical protein
MVRYPRKLRDIASEDILCLLTHRIRTTAIEVGKAFIVFGLLLAGGREVVNDFGGQKGLSGAD